MKHVVLFLVLLCPGLQAVAQLVDPTFAVNGYTPNNGFSGVPTEMVVQSDGKIVLSLDRSVIAPQDPWANIIRYMPDGSVDAGFGTGGRATIWVAGDDVKTQSVSMQSDGKIVATGHGDYCNQIVCGMDNIFIARFTSQGTIDSTFGTNGQVRAPELFGDYIMQSLGQHVTVLSSGKILVSGVMQDQQIGSHAFVVRLNSDGTPDVSFGGGDGIALLGTYSGVRDMYINNTGMIFLTGTYYTYTDTANICDGFVIKLFSWGAPDNSFGTQGVVTLNAAKFDYPQAITTRFDGRIVIGGYIERQLSSSGPQTDTAIVYMLEANGTYSSVIPQGYRLLAMSQPSARIADIEVTGTNAIYFIGSMDTVGRCDALVGRLNGDASFDYTFSGTGDSYVTYALGAQATFQLGTSLYNMKRISPTQILVSGGGSPAQTYVTRVLIMRLNAAESVTTGFSPVADASGLTAGPNPFRETIRLENPAQETGRYTVYDNTGRLLTENILPPGITLVDLHQYPVGLYIVVAETSRGRCVFQMNRAE